MKLISSLDALTNPTTRAYEKTMEILDELCHELVLVEQAKDKDGKEVDEVYLWSLANDARQAVEDLGQTLP
jgi:hypothetical protein